MNTYTMINSLDAQISSVVSVLRRPNNTFREIAESNQQKYIITAIAILSLSSFFFISMTTEQIDPSIAINELGYIWDVQYQAKSFGSSLFWNCVSIILVFYLGMKMGGNNSLRKVFSVLSFAMVPALIGGVMIYVLFMNPLLIEGITGIDKESQEFLYVSWYLYFAFIPFVFWSFILSIKAIKIVNHFETAKAFGIFIASGLVVYIGGWVTSLVL